ncbi:hypothetical protein E3N88_42227 [Mikania micrantha]|uniref:Serine aminopeptidase S33 domain-containing protein n=1 Tax=Mikania micrantha TaxID=192012 RepID=A0A5N6LIH3_9ASTR|nr:hypothetical protein E3N88_42227 [Mikania micrantha]
MTDLKNQIDKFYMGDYEAIPAIFESILKRKLAGTHQDSDDELMNEFRKGQPNEIVNEDFDLSSSSDIDSDSDNAKQYSWKAWADRKVYAVDLCRHRQEPTWKAWADQKDKAFVPNVNTVVDDYIAFFTSIVDSTDLNHRNIPKFMFGESMGGTI